MTRTFAKLGDVLEVQSGFAFKTEFFSNSRGVPLIRIRDLGSNETEARYTGPFRPEFIVEPGDYLIGMDGNFRCRKWSGPKALLNQRVCRLRNFSSRVLPEYVFYAVQPRLDAIEASTAFATVKHISARQILDIDLALPPIDSQRRIVDLLTRAEGIVRMRRKAQLKAQAIIPALFLDIFGDPATNPMGWPVVPLAEVAEVQGGLQVTHARAKLTLERPYLRVANVYRALLDLTEVKMLRLTNAEFLRTRLQSGDLLFVEGHGNPLEVGRVAVWDGSIAECTHQNHLIRARPHLTVLLPTFACHLLNSTGGRQSLLRAGKTTSGLSTISAKDVKEAAVMLPPIETQAHFETRSSSVNNIVKHQSRALRTAEATFHLMLAQCFRDTALDESARQAVAADM